MIIFIDPAIKWIDYTLFIYVAYSSVPLLFPTFRSAAILVLYSCFVVDWLQFNKVLNILPA